MGPIDVVAIVILIVAILVLILKGHHSHFKQR